MPTTKKTTTKKVTNSKTSEVNDLTNIIRKTNENIANAQSIFEKNLQIKDIIEEKIKDLEIKEKEHAQRVKQDHDKINKYKNDTIAMISDRKKDLEKKMAELKKFQIEIEKSKKALELEKEQIKKEREELDLEKIKYDTDQNELANSMLKFNELVSNFTVNIDQLKK